MGPHGLVVLFGSGETSASGRRVFDRLFARLSPPIRVAVLETPAGFQPNSALVAGKVADFLHHRLGNYRPEVTVVPARRRGTPDSPDEPKVVAPLLAANVIFLGPGSPTYAVRQLQGSLAWQTLVARHREGAALVLASAATIAAGAHVLPVYEIYKAGLDLHWQIGLDLFGAYGLEVAFVPHWDNREGGEELDTSRCFMGRERFERLLGMLPPSTAVVGIDEHTALILDVENGTFSVEGRGGVTLLRDGRERRYPAGPSFALDELGNWHRPTAEVEIPVAAWQEMQAALQSAARQPTVPPAEVQALAEEREIARSRQDYATADALRKQVSALGWQIQDTPEGFRLLPMEKTV